MNAKLTDDAVAALPLSHGRADLLEEIMRTPVLDDRPVRTEQPRRRTRWVVPAAAAAVVAVLALGSAWWAQGDGDGGSGGTQEVASQPTAGNAGDHVLLTAPGWTVTAMYADKTSGEMTYEKGDQSLELMWGPTSSYDGYVEDRRYIVEPPADGDPLQILGVDAQMWPYSATDHTAIRAVEHGQWIEFRGSGMSKAAYLALLDQLQLVDTATFEAALPDDFVTEGERTSKVDEVLDEIAAVAHPLLPPGVDRSTITSDQNDSYQFGAELSGAVACAWLDEFADAKRAGAQGRMDTAAAVLATAHDWPVLNRMNASGDYPEVVWQYADEVNAGQVPEGYVDGLGCR